MEKDQPLTSTIKEFETVLYTLQQMNDNTDFSALKTPFFNVIKESLKKHEYNIFVGNYKINLLPEELLVSYDDSNTYIETSNMDYYEETTRVGENRIYLLSNNNARVYGSSTPFLFIQEELININGNYTDNYYLEIKNSDTPIQEFIKDPVVEMNTHKAFLTVPITRNSKKYDIEKNLQLNKLQRATYIPDTKKFIIKESLREDLSYTQLLPNIEKKKQIVTTLYKYIIEFYKEWLPKTTRK